MCLRCRRKKVRALHRKEVNLILLPNWSVKLLGGESRDGVGAFRAESQGNYTLFKYRAGYRTCL